MWKREKWSRDDRRRRAAKKDRRDLRGRAPQRDPVIFPVHEDRDHQDALGNPLAMLAAAFARISYRRRADAAGRAAI